jgi:hypothetical protein
VGSIPASRTNYMTLTTQAELVACFGLLALFLLSLQKIAVPVSPARRLLLEPVKSNQTGNPNAVKIKTRSAIFWPASG